MNTSMNGPPSYGSGADAWLELRAIAAGLERSAFNLAGELDGELVARLLALALEVDALVDQHAPAHVRKSFSAADLH